MGREGVGGFRREEKVWNSLADQEREWTLK